MVVDRVLCQVHRQRPAVATDLLGRADDRVRVTLEILRDLVVSRVLVGGDEVDRDVVLQRVLPELFDPAQLLGRRPCVSCVSCVSFVYLFPPGQCQVSRDHQLARNT